jgi:GntR family transcriptional regulator
VLTAQGLDGGSLHEWMREQGVIPSGGPRQVAAVPADELVAGHLTVGAGTPVLLLEGVTLDSHGRGVEWFSAWHAPSTVFDVDAEVATGLRDHTPAPAGDTSPDDDHLARARQLAHELVTLLDSRA